MYLLINSICKIPSVFTEPVRCGGELFAQPSAQVLTSATYPQPYPGGLECLYVLTAPPGKVLTLEVRNYSKIYSVGSIAEKYGINLHQRSFH